MAETNDNIEKKIPKVRSHEAFGECPGGRADRVCHKKVRKLWLDLWTYAHATQSLPCEKHGEWWIKRWCTLKTWKRQDWAGSVGCGEWSKGRNREGLSGLGYKMNGGYHKGGRKIEGLTHVERRRKGVGFVVDF